MGCCTCFLVTQAVLILVLLATIPIVYFTYEDYLVPWGREQAAKAAEAARAAGINEDNVSDAVSSCGDCYGVNSAYPLSGEDAVRSGLSSAEIWIANNGGEFLSAVTSAAVAVGGAASLLASFAAVFASSSLGSSLGSSISAGPSLSFEFGQLVGHGQFLSMLAALPLNGAPVFLLEFCKKFAWTNLQVFPSSSRDPQERRLQDAREQAGLRAVERYSALLGVAPDNLFYYTLLAVVVLAGILGVLYIALRVLIRLWMRRRHQQQQHGMSEGDDLAGDRAVEGLTHRAIGLAVLLLMLLQYPLAMTASFELATAVRTHSHYAGAALAVVVLVIVSMGFLMFSVLKLSAHRLDGLAYFDTDDHDASAPFHLKYGALYQDFNRANVFFFVLVLVRDMVSGVVVGAWSAATKSEALIQIAVLVALQVAFVVLVVARKPFQLKLFYVAALVAGYLRVVVLLLTVAQLVPDECPQRVRNVVAEVVIAANALLLLCLAVRQLYVAALAARQWWSDRQIQKLHQQAHEAIAVVDDKMDKIEAGHEIESSMVGGGLRGLMGRPDPHSPALSGGEGTPDTDYRRPDRFA